MGRNWIGVIWLVLYNGTQIVQKAQAWNKTVNCKTSGFRIVFTFNQFDFVFVLVFVSELLSSLCLDLFVVVLYIDIWTDCIMFLWLSAKWWYRMQSESKTVDLKAATASLGTNHCINDWFGFLLKLCLFFVFLFVCFVLSLFI